MFARLVKRGLLQLEHQIQLIIISDYIRGNYNFLKVRVRVTKLSSVESANVALVCNPFDC